MGHFVRTCVIFILGLFVGTNLGVILMCTVQVALIQRLRDRLDMLKMCHDEHYRDMLALMRENGLLWEIIAKFVPLEGIGPLQEAIRGKEFSLANDHISE